LNALAAAAPARSLEVFGYAGVLGEWELTAAVTESTARRTKEFSGPVTMTHVGLCTADGPEERKGQIRARISPTRMRATISVDGVECSYRALFSEAYIGTMTCPGRPPMPLRMWLK
jgi:hypothetical protein